MDMRNPKNSRVLPYLRTLLTEGNVAALSDRQLLERFAQERGQSVEAGQAAEIAFEALVDRHSPMVWGVCRRVLGDVHEAEDAFQATFMLLVRKARSLDVDDSLGRWLYGVAHRVAVRARFHATRRSSGRCESPVTATDDPHSDLENSEIREIVGTELDRLPLKYRCAVELCDVQGLTHDEAARQLAWPLATVKSRLTRGRVRLRGRLTRRGIAPMAAGVISALCAEASVAAPAELVRSAIRYSMPLSAAAPPPAITILVKEALQMMVRQKIQLAVIPAVLAAGLVVVALAGQAPPASPKRPLQATADVGAQPIRRQTTPDPRWSRVLPSGAMIEVIGVSPHPSGADTWYRPDGTSLTESPCDAARANVTARADGIVRAIVARFTSVRPDAERQWQILESNSGGWVTPTLDGVPVAGLHEWVGVVPRSLKTCTARFVIGSGPWTTDATHEPSEGPASSERRGYMFSEPVASQHGTTVTLTHTQYDVFLRLAAVDRDDKEWFGSPSSSYRAGELCMFKVEFRLPLANIKHFRVQIQPQERVEIAGVALDRDKPVSRD
jgi:RNA polymerase sigma factor (sigma-70 family)